IPVSKFFGFDEVLMNIERIEVLKGPQGSLYGKDTEAGAINIITRQPGNDFEGKVNMQLGSDNKREYAFNAAGPIIADKLFIGLSGRHYEKDGQIANPYLGGRFDDRSDNYGRLQLRATPIDNLEISLMSSFFKYGNGDVAFNLSSATKKEVPSDIHGYDNSEILSHALQVKYNIGRYQLEGFVTQREYKEDSLADLDLSSATLYHNYVDSSLKKRSGELRLSSVFGKLNWLVGIYGDDEKDLITGTTNNIKIDDTNRDDTSIGLFAHASYELNDRLSLTAGIRYDKEDKTYKEGSVDLADSFSAFSPKVAVDYKLFQNTMIYASVARGYRSGGFDILAPAGKKAYDKETLINYEIGTKNSFLDNTLLLNLALYYMDISDMQVRSSRSNNPMDRPYITNAATATSQGLELEMRYKISRSLEVFGGFAFNHTEFDKYSDFAGDYSGNTNPYAPEYSGNIGAQYRASNGLFARCDLTGYGKTYLDKTNTYERDPYALVNAKIGYESDSFDIYLYADNLLDEEYDSREEYVVYYSQPLEIGVKLSYRF
ncbi:MAG: TonB-dependent receptor, partial [Deltaproteobacteria bacterium]